jgi:predicted small secreted protein
MGYGNRRMKTIFLASITALVCAFSSSCNTTIGVGRDMRILGENMEHAANKKQQGSGGGEHQDTGGAPVY